MSLKKQISRVLPVNAFVELRNGYRWLLKFVFRPLSEDEFKSILVKPFGIKSGSVVFVHSSVVTLNINFSVYRLLEILLEAVGENGTLVFPAWHFTHRAEDYLNKQLIFDVKRSPSVLGLLSELARRHPLAIRSNHPINSIVAIGKNAQEIVGEHGNSIYPCDESSPYYKIIKYDGIIVGLGVDTNFLSFVHCPEDIMKQKFPVKTRLDNIFESKVKKIDGSMEIIKTLAAHPQIKYNDINAFLKNHLSKTICNNFTIKGNRFFVAQSKELFDSIVELANKNITIYTKLATEKNFK